MAVLATAILAAPSSAWALGFGAEVGRVQARSGPVGNSRGVFGRLSLLGPLDLQLDVAKTEYSDLERRDTRYGAGLRLEPFHLGKWLPALIAGLGVLDIDTPAWQGQLGYRELGLGLVYELNKHVRLELDLRQGRQDVLVQSKNQAPVPEMVLPADGSGQEYRSGSLGLSIDF